MAALVAATSGALPAAAAVAPRAGSVLTGAAAGQPIVVKVTRRGKAVSVTLTCRKRKVVFENLPVSAGRFSGDRNEATARSNPVAHVQGRFVSATRAKGRFTAQRCPTKRGSWTARRR